MPVLSEMSHAITPVHTLIIGMSKAGKTKWAADAAEAGFNVFFLDGDVSFPTLQKLSPAAKSRLWYLAAHDSVEHPRFNRILRVLLDNKRVLWNDSTQTTWKPGAPIEESAQVWDIEMGRMTLNDVVVVDSWSTLCWAMLWDFALANNIQIAETDKHDRSVYATTGNEATYFLNKLRILPCHLIVTAHVDEYQKVKTKPGLQREIKEGDKVIEWTRMVPKSTSRPHALQVARHFTDILWIEVDAMGNRLVDGRAEMGREGGSAISERKYASEFTFAALAKAHGCPDADPSQPIGGIQVLDAEARGQFAAPIVEQSGQNPLSVTGGAQKRAALSFLGGNKK
jgi:hypothetical protein